MTSTELLVILPLAFCSGLINAAVGGGGLIMIPGLFATLPQATPAALLGSDKLSSIVGHAFAARQYARRIDLPWRLLGITGAAAFVGSYSGAHVVHSMPANLIRPLVIVLLIVMLAYTWLRPQLGATDTGRPIQRKDIIVGVVAGAGIGFYDGFFGPGAGSFLMFLFVRVFHFDFLRASASAKVVNMATNLAALSFFIPAGLVIYKLAIPMGIAGVCGAFVGTHLAFKGGNLWIRRLFLVLAILLLGKLIFETAVNWH
ncbi:MAG: TSUP family transporter [Rhodocyclaceae bacterium]